MRFLIKLVQIPQRQIHRQFVRRLNIERRNTEPEYCKAYSLFDKDGDAIITEEELLSILLQVGENPGDMGYFFHGKIPAALTTHHGVVDWITYMVHNSKLFVIFLTLFFIKMLS